MKIRNVLNTFAGMEVGHFALNDAEIEFDKYYSSEIDKYAIKVSENNFPDIIRLGDVTKWREWNIDWGSIDLFMGGSHCQGFSFAGKQLAFDDPRSALFFTFVDILNHIRKFNPNVKFLLENVSMRQEYLDVISEYLGVEPVKINSALVCAQSRLRYYWANWKIEQPEDRGIMLKDILEERFDGEYHLMRDKSKTLRVGGGNSPAGSKQEWDNVYKDKTRCIEVGHAGLNTCERDNRVYSDKGKCPTLIASSGGYKEKKVSTDGIYWRKLTVVESERLMSLPDNATAGVSDTQRRKMLGNGWEMKTISHILAELKKEKTPSERFLEGL